MCLNWISQAIFDKRGSNILALDLRTISELVDYVVIAEGTVGKHVVAIAQEVIDTLEKQGIRAAYVEGLKEGDWVVIDLSDIVVHLFQPEWRERYQLEALWRQADIVDVHIDTHAEIYTERDSKVEF